MVHIPRKVRFLEFDACLPRPPRCGGTNPLKLIRTVNLAERQLKQVDCMLKELVYSGKQENRTL